MTATVQGTKILVHGDRGRLICGDNYTAMERMEPETVDLVYMDPPFNSGHDRAYNDLEYADTFESAKSYTDFMFARIHAAWKLLKRTGHMYVHIDDAALHDLYDVTWRVTGRRPRIIVWARGGQHNDCTTAWPRVCDFILHTSKPAARLDIPRQPRQPSTEERYNHTDPDGRRWARSQLQASSSLTGAVYHYEFMGKPGPWTRPKASMLQLQAAGRILPPTKRSGGWPSRKTYLDESRGPPVTALWTDIPPVAGGSVERAGYPTQKPVALLDRIIRSSSPEGGIVLDPFAGSGTTGVAARKALRRYVLIDRSADAIRLANERLLAIPPPLESFA